MLVADTVLALISVICVVLLRRMRLELSLWARFRGLLSLRSLQRGALR